MKFPTLYKKTSKGKIEQWTISVDDNRIISTYGHIGGKMQTATEVVLDGKNIGKANETTILEQANLQAQSEWTAKKSRKGYSESIDDAHAGVNHGDGGIRPMLAQSFSKHGDKIEFPCFVQPKLDGIRCLAVVADDGSVSLWSREQKQIVAVPVIARAVEQLKLKPGTVLDGELYNHALKNDFEKIISCVRKQYEALPEDQELIQYHVYDMPRNPLFGKQARDFAYRSRELMHALVVIYSNYIKCVTTDLVESEEDLLEILKMHQSSGYEGAMARNSSSLYEEGKRSYGLQKLKDFEDSEFPIVGVECGKGKMSDMAIFVCQTESGSLFNCKMEGKLDDLKKFLINEKLWRGKLLTVKYQGLTGKSKVPRFPVGKCVRDYE